MFSKIGAKPFERFFHFMLYKAMGSVVLCFCGITTLRMETKMFKVYFFTFIKNNQISVVREFKFESEAKSFARALRTPWKITRNGEYLAGEKFLSF
jgi:hypothetical protein